MSEQEKALPERVEVVDIQFRPGQKVYFFDPAGITCKAGDHVIIDTSRGLEYGICTGGNHKVAQTDVVAPLRQVVRLATEEDEKTAEKNKQTEKKAFALCEEKIRELNLDMQLVSAECAFDGSKILFFFTAEDRVDFRELVKNLAAALHSRIELRQIGVRDEAKMVGGLGICGRPFCCSSFLEEFLPMSIKMAKTQNLSLNPTKISGTCGRLMCCLRYEQEAYEDLLRTSPKAESFVDTPDGRGTVVEIDLLRQRVKVKMEDRPEVIGTYRNDEIAVLRSGKAKKNDPPIPADLAPISGCGRKCPRRQQEEESLQLEPVRFRYSTEQIVPEEAPEEAVTEPSEEQTQERQGRSRNRRRRRPGKRPEQAQKEEKPQQPKEQAAPVEGEKRPKRRPHYRRRRGKTDKTEE
ncbi:MAG: stage 0 sporulation family protein [Oscillospiraceae bacterium]|nr:stage 0 sporulation family protein [Oscillospiraceae bacterium]